MSARVALVASLVHHIRVVAEELELLGRRLFGLGRGGRRRLLRLPHLRRLLLLLFLLLTAFFLTAHLLLFSEMVTLGFVSRNAVVSLVVRGNGSRRLEVLEQVLLLVSLKFATLLHSVHALARLMTHSSFDRRRVLISLLETLEVHPTEASDDVEAVLLNLVVGTELALLGSSDVVHAVRVVLQLPVV